MTTHKPTSAYSKTTPPPPSNRRTTRLERSPENGDLRSPENGDLWHAPKLLSEPCFRIKSGPDSGELSCSDPYDLAGGTRLRVVYGGGQVVAIPSGIVPQIFGKVVSGGDWIFIRNDNVAVFDARLTLGTSPVLNVDARDEKLFEEARPVKDREIVFDVVLCGVADLGPVGWSSGFSETLRVAIPARFEGATRTEPWAMPRFRALSENFSPFTQLLRRQCLAIGDVKFAAGKVIAVRFEIQALVPDVGGPVADGKPNE